MSSSFEGPLETSSKCGLLQQETEVIISPKSRHSSMLPSSIQSNKGRSCSNKSNDKDISSLLEKTQKYEDSSQNRIPSVSNNHDDVSTALSESPKIHNYDEQTNESAQNHGNQNKDVFRGIYDFLNTFWSGTVEQQKKKDMSHDWHREFLPQSESLDCTLRVENFGEIKELVPHPHDPKPLSVHEQPTNVYLSRSTYRKFLVHSTELQSLPATFLAHIKRVPSPNEQQKILRKQMTKSNASSLKDGTSQQDQTEEVGNPYTYMFQRGPQFQQVLMFNINMKLSPYEVCPVAQALLW